MSILQLSEVRKKMPFHINYGLSAFTIRDLLEKNFGYSLDFDVYLPSKKLNLQRPFCWTLHQKQELIMSLLKGIHIPMMSFIHYEHKVFKIIDGKQRLSAWLWFCEGKFPIIFNGNEYYFKDLDNWAQGELMWTNWVKADVAYEYEDKLISDEWKIAWFEMINFMGTPQDIEHLNSLKNK
ncbi:MAG: DUF262 domain-containing protein [Candidatus Paceibacterota bacterium]